MERILNMIIRRLVNKGVNFGIKAAANMGNKNREQSPEDRQLNKQGQNGTRHLRQATRMMRRFTKL
ncbi:MAG: hypothetical protein ABF254_12140 [Octadecabacter sp.]